MAKFHVLNDPDSKPLEFEGFRKYDLNTNKFEGMKLVELDRFGLTCEG